MEDTTKINETIEIDRTNNGKLSVSINVIKKLIHHLLTSENYQVDFNNIKITSKANDDLETQIQVMVNEKSNLIKLKNQIINLILKRISAVLNVNIVNINLIFATN
ncbi:MAG: hypothetical protein ACRC8P_02080 [Spiroplasma sp.]